MRTQDRQTASTAAAGLRATGHSTNKMGGGRLCHLAVLILSTVFAAGCGTTGSTPPCTDLSGTYRSLSKDAGERLAQYLTGNPHANASTVTLASSENMLTVQVGTSNVQLRRDVDFSCEDADGLLLKRTENASIRLPPLINQTVSRSFVLKRSDALDLQIDVYTRTSASPYGFELNGPRQFDRTVVWPRRPEASNDKVLPVRRP